MHRIVKRSGPAYAAAALCALLSYSAAAQTISNIGILSPTGQSSALGVNADGTAVVGYSSYGSALRAVRWTSTGGLQNLGVLPGGIRSLGFAISADGSSVTGMCVLSGTGHVFLWTTENGMQDLGTLPGQNVSYGYAISGDGLMVGGGTSTGAIGHAFTWKGADGLVDLGTLPGATTSALYGLNADGSAGTGFSGSFDGDRAIRWTSVDGMQSLGVLPGGTVSEGDAISADGTTVTGFGDTPSGQHAFRWTNAGGLVDLGTIPGHATSAGLAISAEGSVIAGNDEFGAILWTSTLGWVDLRTYLASQGVNVANWTLSACYGISRDGTALVGDGRINGLLRGWVVSGLPSLCAPRITSQPTSASICPSGTATFAVTVAASGLLQYQWQIETAPGTWVTLGNDPVPLPCGGAAFATNPNSPTTPIGLQPCAGIASYQIRCVVSNPCSSTTSAAATLTVITTGDMNCDCAVNNFDIDPFVLAISDPGAYQTMYPGCDINYADIDGDGYVNNFDIDPFIVCLSTGCP